MKNHYFSLYEKEKWNWTQSAVNKFRSGFKRFDLSLQEKEQVYIGVYGPTQVGKTTFILHLLGIEKEHLPLISEKLRGGREKGNSSTVTCTIFERTDSSSFEVIWPTGKKFICSTLNELEDCMSKLRSFITKSIVVSTDPVVIKIPSIYFSEQAIHERARDLAIVDLPGDDTKDQSEITHVNHVLSDYLIRCKVVLIMEISNQMTSLFHLQNELVKDWQYLPHQFRVILTRSISDETTLNMVRNRTISNSQELKEYYLQEMEKISGGEVIETELYPLEFGESWMGVQIEYPDIFYSASRWITEIFSEIIEDLTKIYSPEQEIRKLKSIVNYIDKKRDDEIKNLKKQYSLIESEIQRIELERKYYYQLINQESMKLKNLIKYRSFWRNVNLSSVPIIQFVDWDKLNFHQREVKSLQSHFYSLQEEQKKYAEEMADYFKQWVRKGEYMNIRKLKELGQTDQFFEEVFPINYIFPHYISKHRYFKDKEECEKLLLTNNTHFEKYIETVQMHNLEITDSFVKKKTEIIKNLKVYFKKISERIDEAKRRLDHKLEEIEIANQEWDIDKERANQLNLYLMQSFAEHSKRFKEVVLNPEISIIEKWYAHQYWNLMKLQAEGMISICQTK